MALHCLPSRSDIQVSLTPRIYRDSSITHSISARDRMVSTGERIGWVKPPRSSNLVDFSHEVRSLSC